MKLGGLAAIFVYLYTISRTIGLRPDHAFLCLIVFVFLVYGRRWGKAFLIDWSPFILFWVAYDMMRGIADSIRGQINATGPFNIEASLFGWLTPAVVRQLLQHVQFQPVRRDPVAARGLSDDDRALPVVAAARALMALLRLPAGGVVRSGVSQSSLRHRPGARLALRRRRVGRQPVCAGALLFRRFVDYGLTSRRLLESSFALKAEGGGEVI